MNQSSVRLQLHLGRRAVSPAPERMMRALESVEVQQTDGQEAGFGQGFTITWRAERSQTVSEDFELITHPLLKPGSRVVVSVTVGTQPKVLVDGIISQHQFMPAMGQAGARLVVTGADLSAMMDLLEISIGYPGLDHRAVALMVMGKYAMFGVMPQIKSPLRSWRKLPVEEVPYQTGTDLQYLRELARQHGHVFGIKPGPRPGVSRGYWGPLVRIGLPQQALNVDMGNATNVSAIQFSNDGLAPTQVYGTVHQRDKKTPQPILAPLPKLLPLSRQPSILANQPFVKKRRLDYKGHIAPKASSIAQGIVDMTSSNTVTAQGTVDVLRYRDLLFAPGIVPVRGVGASYDGFYYVKKVNHSIQPGAYKQEFTLTREGTGSLTKRV